ncbi:hypothetical protein ACFFFQ_00575 [Mesonia mobilis]|uniref:Uncharacterized protein n=1 Tax=Mesonia mobilis TaxID=369791 RepID=A0ABQ3C6J5_9FLAO|nr:hypothetical protein GCM10008088_28690 [Mesonia mobilis]
MEKLCAEIIKNPKENLNSAKKLTQTRGTETDKVLLIKISQHYSIFQNFAEKK